jgi:hypothetical protein
MRCSCRSQIPLVRALIVWNLEIPKDLIFHDLGSNDPEWSAVARRNELHNFVERPIFQLDARRLGESAQGVALGLWIRGLQVKRHRAHLLRTRAAEQFERNCVRLRTGKQLIQFVLALEDLSALRSDMALNFRHAIGGGLQGFAICKLVALERPKALLETGQALRGCRIGGLHGGLRRVSWLRWRG